VPADPRRDAVLERLDPELARALADFPLEVDPGDYFDDPEVLRMLRSSPDILAMSGAPPATDGRVVAENRMVDGPTGPGALGLRIYRPTAATSALPAVVFSHGGAFIIGNPYQDEHRCRTFAAEAECVVVSVDWRHAPEHPFPAGVEDAYGAFVWTVSHAGELGVDEDRVAVGGASSGGAFAAASALMARDRGAPMPVMQVLVYPVIDDRQDTPSMLEFDAAPLWTRGATARMWELYLGPGGGEANPYAAPGRATDLGGLPPAYVMAAELDPLRDEAIAYARRLLQAGVPTELHCFAGACHGFDTVAPTTALARRAITEQVGALRRGFAARRS
jgi:acetyl esterase/lipase